MTPGQMMVVVGILSALGGILIGIFLGRSAGPWPVHPQQCGATINSNSVFRCEAMGDLRCKGGNCTRHCLDMCKCVVRAVEDEQDKRAHVDLGFLRQEKK